MTLLNVLVKIMTEETKLLLKNCIDQHMQAVAQSNTMKPEWYPDPETDPLDAWQWLVDNGYFETTGAELSDGVVLTGKALDWGRR